MKNKRSRAPKATPAGAKRGRTATLPVAKKNRIRGEGAPRRRPADAPPRERDRRPGTARVAGPTREQRPGPARAPLARPTRPKNTSQAKARANARKAKAPKVVRPPLRERLITRLAQVEFNPRALLARVPFVVLVIAALGLGLGVTLWLSTDSAERSYQLGHARKVNQTLQQQKESLERQVLEAQAAPALAEAARGLGMIPSRSTAHLVQDGAGHWFVVGTPKPAEGVPPPPLNVKLGVERVPAAPPPPPAPVSAPAVVAPGEPLPATPPNADVEAPVRTPAPLDHAAAGPVVRPEGVPGAGPAPGPAADALTGPAPAPAPAPLTGPAPGPVPGVGTLPGPVAEIPAPAAAPVPPADSVAAPAAPAPAPVPAPGAPA